MDSCDEGGVVFEEWVGNAAALKVVVVVVVVESGSVLRVISKSSGCRKFIGLRHLKFFAADWSLPEYVGLLLVEWLDTDFSVEVFASFWFGPRGDRLSVVPVCAVPPGELKG